MDVGLADLTGGDGHDRLEQIEVLSSSDQYANDALNRIARPMGSQRRFLGLVEHDVNDPGVVVEVSRSAQQLDAASDLLATQQVERV